LKIQVSAQTIFSRLAVLRHHDDRSLQTSDDSHYQVEHLIRRRIEAPDQYERVEYDPGDNDANRGADEFPTAAKLSDRVGSPIGKRHALCLFFVDVARNALL